VAVQRPKRVGQKRIIGYKTIGEATLSMALVLQQPLRDSVQTLQPPKVRCSCAHVRAC
jgi:hypothetical protein